MRTGPNRLLARKQRVRRTSRPVAYSKSATLDRSNWRAAARRILGIMIIGSHILFYTKDPGAHPTEANNGHELYLMCDDLESFTASLKNKNVHCTDFQQARWGTSTTIPLPSGGSIGLYQPRHATAFNLK